ncbi:MAG: hypothetical protein AABZ33_09755 [Chloroflexota bacterium]
MDRTSQRLERGTLEVALQRARARAAAAMRGSPDWDAAMASVEELEAHLLASKTR